MIRVLSLLGVLSILPLAALPETFGQEGQILPWQRRLQGTWKREKSLISGKESTFKSTTDFYMIFQDNKFSRKSGTKITQEGTYTLNPSGFPLVIELNPTGGLAKVKVMQYAISVTDDVLIMALGTIRKGPDGLVTSTRPDTFEPGPGRIVYYYRRIKE